MNFSHQLKKYREKEQLSQEELAEKIYVSRQTISKWENDKTYPDIHNLIALSILFDITLDELVKGDVEIMKSKISRQQWDFWVYSFTLFIVLTPLSFGPTMKYLGFKGMWIPLVLGSWMLFSCWMVERLKKRQNLKTYSQIISFMEQTKVDDEKVAEELKYHKVKNVVAGMVSGIVTLLLISISFFLFK
ncbi:helix-turn-helix domain-containing protein [Vagococcus silagei]|uniref:XRE family transcriptional regulator n=1 Tax=Vagococcus silagei TaxID=2508885 RepID=A0A4S3B6Y2_9ENTE|nr:helix-turn-helix transcriptional regulator [Vagococcus silagei]THB62428.1 XRE family transcriptional regulator [Vagococcus silagei]